MSEIDYYNLVQVIEAPACAVRFAAIKKLGLEGAAFLQQAAFFSDKMKKTGGWFYLSQVGDGNPDGENSFLRAGSWEALLGIKKDQQVKIRKLLIKEGLLEVERRGVPARLFFRVDPEKYIKWLSNSELARVSPDCEKSQSGLREIANKLAKNRKQVGEKSETIQDTNQYTKQKTTTTKISQPVEPPVCSSNFDDVKKENPNADQGAGVGVEFNIPKNLKQFYGEIITATAGLDLKTCQELVNQMSSGLQDGEIHSPGAWLKKMATLARKGDFNFVESKMPKQKTESVGEYVEKIKQDQAAKAVEDARLKASRQSNREALDCLKALVPAAREALEREFALYLSKTNTMAAMFFKRSGFQNPLVISQFKTFSNTTTPLVG